MVVPVVLAIVMGVLGRVLYLRPSSGDFPTRPHGLIIHLFLGFVASVLGGFAVVAIAKGNVTAGVFLGLGTAQYHKLRSVERAYLHTVDKDEVVPRGASYVEGMASAFEARDFLVFVTAGITSLVALLENPLLGALAGLVWIAASQPFVRGRELKTVALVKPLRFEVRDGTLTIDGIGVHEVSQKDETDVRDGWAAAISARDFPSWLALENRGQKQAIRHDFTTRFGRAGEPRAFWPLVVPDKAKERLLFFSVAEAGDERDWLGSFDHYALIETAFRSSRHLAVRKRPTPEPRPSLQ